MVRNKDSGGIKSNVIVAEVQKRPCLYDTNHHNYGDRAEKARSWEDACKIIVPGWGSMSLDEKYIAGKDVQKRWRSIRDSFTKAYRQGKCVSPENCPPNSRRYLYHNQMSFLRIALQNKKPRYSYEKGDNFSDISNSPQHVNEDYLPKIPAEPIQPPQPDLKKDPTHATSVEAVLKTNQTSAEAILKTNQIDAIDKVDIKNSSFEIKIDTNSILPEENIDDDRSFMNSLLPLFKKMNDDKRLMCRIEFLKIVRYALQNQKEVTKVVTKKEEAPSPVKSTLTVTTRSADGSRPIRKRKIRSPSPVNTVAPKRRGPGRPRKIRPPSDADDECTPGKKRIPNKMDTCERIAPFVEPKLSELEEEMNKVSSLAQMETQMFLKMYNLHKVDTSPILQNVKIEPVSQPSDTPPS